MSDITVDELENGTVYDLAEAFNQYIDSNAGATFESGARFACVIAAAWLGTGERDSRTAVAGDEPCGAVSPAGVTVATSINGSKVTGVGGSPARAAGPGEGCGLVRWLVEALIAY